MITNILSLGHLYSDLFEERCTVDGVEESRETDVCRVAPFLQQIVYPDEMVKQLSIGVREIVCSISFKNFQQWIEIIWRCTIFVLFVFLDDKSKKY